MKKLPVLLLLVIGSVFLLTLPSPAAEISEDLTRPSAPPGPGWALDRINQQLPPLDNRATKYLDASGVTVYVVDSGIYDDADEFGTRLRNGYTNESVPDENGNPVPVYVLPADANPEIRRHGTAVASIIGGRRYGVAKNVNLVNVKVTDHSGAFTAADLIPALEFVLTDAMVPANSVKVVNISLLSPGRFNPYNNLIDDEVKKLVNNGITVVVGAGNEGVSACYAGSPARLGKPSSPGAPSTITVSATSLVGLQDQRTINSSWVANFGECVDVFAPGDEVDTSVGTFSGASAATPFVTGLVAHLVAANVGNPQPRRPAQIESMVKALAAHDIVANADTPSPTNFLRLPGVVGDFDNDGYTDLLFHNDSTGNVAAWLMNGTAYQINVDLPGITNTDYKIGGVADFDRDGDPDIVWNNAVTGANAIWEMNGTTLLGVINLPTLSAFHLRGTGDFNGDGEVDLVVRREPAPGAPFDSPDTFTALWLLHGTSYLSTVNLPSLPGNFRLSGAGDFNGDGSPDLVWRNSSNGANAVWLMNGTAFGSILDLPALPDLNYHIGAVADYNGDGRPDIVWRNQVSGAVTIWVMKGAVVSGVVNLPTLTLEHWDIESPK